MIAHDDAFKFLKTILSSPAFRQQKQKELMSMIRQLGCPTFFLTLSEVETKWPELPRILKEILDDIKLPTDAVLELQWNERAELIRRDPVTCARYLNHRSKELYTTIKERLRGIANKFQNCSEESAQEVPYHLLNFLLSKCSRANVYINTGPAGKRVEFQSLNRYCKVCPMTLRRYFSQV